MASFTRSFIGVTLGGVAACDPGSAHIHATRVDASAPALHAASAVAAPRLTISALPMGSVIQAEDGHGHTVTVLPDPHALDLRAEGWSGRALDPVLHVGDLRFHLYSFPAREVMRFVVDDASRLPAGAEVWLQWGDDVGSKIVVTRSLEVPK